MRVCDTSYGDFIVWRQDEMVMEHILVENKFLDASLEKATNIFIYGILPEVLGKWYSRLPNYLQASSENETASSQEEMWCFCHTPESEEMIACDNEQCKIIWFHTTCLRME